MNGNEQRDDFAASDWWRILPAWSLSLIAHLAFAIVGTLVIRGHQQPADTDEGVRRAEIVLVQRKANQTEYFSEEQSAARNDSRANDSATSIANALLGGAAKLADDPPLLPGISLPELPGALPPGDSVVVAPQLGTSRGPPRFSSPLDDAAILAADAAIPREQVPTGPTARLSLFGSAPAEGRSFVFVIDRSASMGSGGLGAIQAAARELLTHIDSLSAEQTFQVVAYNQSVVHFTERGLIPATDDNRRKLVKFVADLAAFGPTEHMRGLLAALRMKPEVIFLLTDGGDPALDPGQLRVIREQTAGRTSIHCIQFGSGPLTATTNFLQRLAAENRGSYAYIDMSAR